MSGRQVLSDRQSADVRQVLELGRALGCAVYLVGGVVRDLLLGHSLQQKDLDFIVEGEARLLAERVAAARGAEYRVFPQFLTAKVLGQGEQRELDFATARTEVYEAPGRLPRVKAAKIGDDLRRRDFTVNSIALPAAAMLESLESTAPIKAQCIDPFRGMQDLELRLIRVLHDKSFVDDPTRIFRALRYQSRIGGALEPHTEQLMKSAIESSVLGSVSPARQLNELKKICEEDSWYEIFCSLDKWELLPRIGIVKGAIARSFEALRKQEVKVSPEALYQALLSVCYFSLESVEAERAFLDKGFGRKLFRRFEEEREVVAQRGGDLQRLSQGSLIYVAVSGAGEELKRAAINLAADQGCLTRKGVS